MVREVKLLLRHLEVTLRMKKGLLRYSHNHVRVKLMENLFLTIFYEGKKN